MKRNFYPIGNASRQIFGLFLFFFLFPFCAHTQAQLINTVAGQGTAGYSGDGGPATAAEIYYTWSLASDRAGGFYIGSDYFGVSGYNRVRRVNAAGIITTYAGNGGTPSFGGDGGPATAASFYYPGGVATDAAGNLFIEDEGNYRIRKVNTSGIISTIAGTGTPGYSGDGGPATAAELESWDDDDGNDIASDPAGNVYFFEWEYYRIRRIDAATGIITTYAGNGSPGHTGDGGPATAATLGYGYGIAADGAGNVYYSDWSYQCIRKIDASGIITTIAGTGTAGYTGDGGPATAAEIYTLGLAVDGSGYLYLAEYTYNRIRRIDPAGIITTIAGTGAYNFSGDGGPATAATFRDVWGVTTDYSGDIYLGDLENWRVREIYGHNRPVTFTGGHSLSFTVCENTVGDSTNSLLAVHDSDYWQTETWRLISGPAHGTAPDSITATANGGIVIPYGLYYTPTFGYSGPDSFKMRVTDGYVWDTTTVHVTVNPIPSALTGTTTCFTGGYTTLGSTPSGGTWSSGAAAIATAGAATGFVFGVTAGAAGITYTLPTGCINITTVNVLAYAGQTISTVAGNGTAGSTGDSGPATAAEINQAYNVAFDATGNMYIADFSNNRIRKVNTSGVITTIAGTGTAGFSGDGGAASAAKLNGPFGIAIDASGNIYFTDGNNHCARKINTSGTITSIAGTAGTPGLTGDGGPATAGELYYPAGIALDGAGNIYIADEWNNRIRKVNAATGVITSIAGNGATGYLAGGFGGDGTAATSAQINYPEGVTLDASGNIYITDGGNQRVRKINTSGVITTVAGNGSPGYGTDGVAAISTKLDYPDGIVVDPIGNMYIGDAVNNRVRKVNTSGIISTIAGNGTGAYSGDACTAAAGELNTPEGLAADGAGNLYVADRNNYRIRKISYNHAPSFIAGHVQSASMCQNSTDSLNTALAITDVDNAQGETWSVLTGASSGTLAAAYTATSNGGALTPGGLYYKPTIGFTGSDSFRIVVTDCSGGADTTKIVVVVNPPPSAITGASTVCAGVTAAFSDPVGIGVWSSNNTAAATVTAGPSGSTVVTGVAAGVATITYSPGVSCSVTKTVTVIAAPHAITGSQNLCLGHTVSLTDSAAGGTWSSAVAAIASVTSGGVATGVALGATTISYILGGCPAVLPVTVNAIPSFIYSLSHICAGDVTVVVDGTPGGSWSTASSAIATVNPASGLLAGTGPGLAFITYTMPTGCAASTSMVVYALPDTITGPTAICVGSSATMGDATPGGGIWSIPGGLAGAVTVTDSLGGVISGTATGTATLLYTALSSGCAVSSTVTVNPAPSVITGDSTVCTGSGISLADSTTGGAWSSSITATATIDAAAGAVSGLLPGTTVITYSAGAGCAASKTITVNPIPLGITGTTSVCVGLTTTLSDGVTGGAWSSGNTAVATVSSTGGPATVHGASSGTVMITYTLPGGCFATTTVTVNSSPGGITGALHVCIGQTTPLGDPITGGTWISGSIATASVNLTSGLVTGGTTTGPVTITYSLGAGCTVTAVVTVNPLPAGITGTASVCAGLTTTLLDAGGTWSNTSTSIATVASGSGMVTGVSSGTSIITFTLPTGCITTKTVTVNPLPSVPGVTLTLCPGTLITLSSLPFGGAWSSSSTTIATVGSSSGTVGGIAPGTSLITYTLGTGCARSAVVTVNTLPGLFTVSGGGGLCAGGAGVPVSLSGSAPGVSYQLYNGAAPADTAVPGTGVPLNFGIKTIAGTYTVVATSTATGCSRAMAGSAIVTVNPLPPAVTGPTAECIGASLAETDGITGGTWASGTTTVATVTPGPAGGGIVWGVATGTTVITYTLPTGCSITDTITVSLSPVGISGAAGVCVGDTTTLTDAVSGGAWSSSNTAAATIGSLTGLVTGAAPGATTITYSLGTGCTVTKTMTVNNSPAGISGALDVCAGATTGLGDATTGGVWSPAAGSIATVNASGTVRGVSAGVQVISYTVGGCAATAAVTVNPAPAAIGFTASSVCPGNTTGLSDGVAGGIWSSSNTAVASVGTTGMVTGGNSGAAVITYSLGAGCIATKTITVNPIYAITGPTGVCVGATAMLSDLATGGTWSSGTTTVATVNASGTMGGVFPGSSIITYTTAAGCTATTTVTVNLAPSAISGNLHVCAGATTTLSDAAGGGTWTSATTGVATAALTGPGVVTGVIPGTSIITYSLGSGCIVNATVTVNPSPAAITGTAIVCAGATTNLADGTGGGLWSPSTGTIATVNGAGMVSGISAGTATITYSPGSGCFAVKTVTVTPAPGPITGIANVCVGLAITLSDTSAGGVWHSGNTGIAVVDPATGIVTAVSPGTVTIADSLFGCAAAASVVVNSAPGAIFGTLNMCIGASATLSDPTSGGAWSPATGSVATVNAAGVVSGVSAGTAAVSYSVGGCPAIATVTVNSLPDNPTATSGMNVCVGSAIILTDAPAGGTWSSPAGGGIVMVDATTGAVTGEGAGTASVTYSLGAGCTASTIVTVNPLPAIPAVVGGAANICKGYTTIVTDATGGGTWSASPDSVATITSLGIVTGTGGGAATISYTISTGCPATTPVYVTAVPAITGATHLCAYGDTVDVYDAMPGGTWSSTLATVSTAGLVTGYAAGTATVTYTVVSGCYALTALTVNPVPGPVTGSGNVCVGTATTLSDTASSGAWSPATGSVATVSATGIVTGVSAGTAVISYTLPVTGCMRTLTVTVDPHPSVPAASASSANVCAGATITLSDTVAGGVWSSAGASAGIATVGAATGIVSAVSAGVATITYSLAPGCTATKAITVNPLPTVYAITGGGNYCAGTAGADIALGGADAGISYSLYHGATAAGTITGPVSDFGMEALAGVYTVVATNTATGCVTAMPGSVTVGITPSVIPSVTMSVTPANTVCAGTAVNFTTTVVNSGTSPAYQWTVNTAAVAGATSATYSYTPADNDVVKTTLTSSAACAIPATVSDSVTMTVVTPVIPAVAITATPGTIVKPGQSVTLTAVATGGTSYTYQWEIDGSPVAGATNATFVNSYNTADTVTCMVMGGGICNPEGSGQVVITMSSSGSGVGVAPVNAPGAEVMVIPNPNNGEFIIKGSLGTSQDEEATIEITDMLGQVVYKDKVTVQGGKLEAKVQLNKDIANGMYLLNLQAAGGNNVFHIVVAR